jgi:hypothetical protein
MPSLATEYPIALLEPPEPPCLSLYQPTHRRHPENQQDVIRFRNLVRALETSLRQKYPTREIRPLLEPFVTLGADQDFWNHALDGLAVFGATGVFHVYQVQRPVPELAVAADSFHIKPLLRIVQSADRYQVLAVDRKGIRLFEGNRDVLDEIEIAPGVPRTLTDALGSDLTQPHLTMASYRAGAKGAATRYGHGSKKDEVDRDTERFFRAVDRAVLEKHSQPSKLPLVLSALPQHQAVFRRVSHNPYLVAGSVDVHADSLSIQGLRERAWAVLQPHYLAQLDRLVGEFQEAEAKGVGTDDLAAIATAAAAGRVAVLLVDADQHVPGRLDRVNGRIEFAILAQPDVDDLLDDLGELVLAQQGRVVVVPAGRMPVRSGAAATFRF